MGENRTAPTSVGAAAFLAAVEHPTRRADGETLAALMARITGWDPVMWGPTMVGFGERTYARADGRSERTFVVGFSPRRARLSLYGLTGHPDAPALLERLGKHATGASCLYVNRLVDIDLDTLEALVRLAVSAHPA